MNEFKKLYSQISNELKNCDMNNICNICKLPVNENERLMLNCNHLYHTTCLNINNKTNKITCMYCEKIHYVKKKRCCYIIPKLKNLKHDLEYYEKLYEEKKKVYEEKKNEINFKNMSNIKDKINLIKEFNENKNKFRCKKIVLNDMKYCINHYNILDKNLNKNKKSLIELYEEKKILINEVSKINKLLEEENDDIHICNFLKKNNECCKNKVKNKNKYCGIHMKKLTNDLNKKNLKLKKCNSNIKKIDNEIKELKKLLNKN